MDGIRSTCGRSLSTTPRTAAAKVQGGIRQPRVVDEDDTLGAVAHGLAGYLAEPAAEDQGDVQAPELPGKLATLAEQLQRDSAWGALDELHHRPAVVAVAGLLPEPSRLLPSRGRRPVDFLKQLEDALGGLLRTRGDLAVPLRSDVLDREDAVGEPVCPNRSSSSSTSSTRSEAPQTAIRPSGSTASTSRFAGQMPSWIPSATEITAGSPRS